MENLKKLVKRILKNKGSSLVGLAGATVSVLRFFGVGIIDEATMVQIMGLVVMGLGFFFGQDKE